MALPSFGLREARRATVSGLPLLEKWAVSPLPPGQRSWRPEIVLLSPAAGATSSGRGSTGPIPFHSRRFFSRHHFPLQGVE
ncbi:unnamed protein product [Arctia plantaginis]|uniref:Uncharacterized protein n=1 Tax=Arctia plantaginis TaxID=874455 RepID=A0A8S0ZZQ5_ARCPL|nr:unnamed protein product [Arctia plantaginis]